MEHIKSRQLAPFQALMNIIKINYVDKQEVYKMLVAVLCNFDCCDQKSYKQTVNYIRILLAGSPDLVDCFLTFLPQPTASDAQNTSQEVQVSDRAVSPTSTLEKAKFPAINVASTSNIAVHTVKSSVEDSFYRFPVHDGTGRRPFYKAEQTMTTSVHDVERTSTTERRPVAYHNLAPIMVSRHQNSSSHMHHPQQKREKIPVNQSFPNMHSTPILISPRHYAILRDSAMIQDQPWDFTHVHPCFSKTPTTFVPSRHPQQDEACKGTNVNADLASHLHLMQSQAPMPILCQSAVASPSVADKVKPFNPSRISHENSSSNTRSQLDYGNQQESPANGNSEFGASLSSNVPLPIYVMDKHQDPTALTHALATERGFNSNMPVIPVAVQLPKPPALHLANPQLCQLLGMTVPRKKKDYPLHVHDACHSKSEQSNTNQEIYEQANLASMVKNKEHFQHKDAAFPIDSKQQNPDQVSPMKKEPQSEQDNSKFFRMYEGQEGMQFNSVLRSVEHGQNTFRLNVGGIPFKIINPRSHEYIQNRNLTSFPYFQQLTLPDGDRHTFSVNSVTENPVPEKPTTLQPHSQDRSLNRSAPEQNDDQAMQGKRSSVIGGNSPDSSLKQMVKKGHQETQFPQRSHSKCRKRKHKHCHIKSEGI